MAYIGLEPSNSFVSLKRQVITGDGTASYTLDHSVASVNDVAIFVNNVRQDPAGYSISGTALTLGGTIESSDDCYVIFLGQALQTVTPDSDTITAAMLKSDSVTTAKIADDAVTSAKTNFFNADTSAADLGTGLHVKTGDSGVTSANTSSDELVVEGSGTSGISILSGNGSSGVVDFGDDGDNNIGRLIYSHADNAMQFHTNASERILIASNGATKMALGGTAKDAGNYHQMVGNGANTYELKILNKNSSPASQYIIETSFTASSPDNSSAKFLQCRDQTTLRLEINSDGDVKNHDNSYGATSDEKLKEQITDASEQWNDIKALRVRKFKYKSDVATGDSNNHWRLGVIAQELEAAGMNKLVTNEADTQIDENGVISETGTTTKAVKYSILYMKAVKALQEAMTRIEQLETRVQTLENA